jgi:hypothetical protein
VRSDEELVSPMSTNFLEGKLSKSLVRDCFLASKIDCIQVSGEAQRIPVKGLLTLGSVRLMGLISNDPRG